MPPTTPPLLRHMPLRYRIAATVLALGCLLIKPVDARPADAQSGASRASEASLAASVEVPIAAVSALVAGSEFVVTGVVASGAVVAGVSTKRIVPITPPKPPGARPISRASAKSASRRAK